MKCTAHNFVCFIGLSVGDGVRLPDSRWETPGNLGTEPGKDTDLRPIECYRLHSPKHRFYPEKLIFGDELKFQEILRSHLEVGDSTTATAEQC